MNLADVPAEMSRLARLLDQGLQAMRDQAREFAEAENAYRLAKAQAWLSAPDGTVPEREAWVGGKTAGERQRRDLADGMRQAALEAVRSRRAQISALQTLVNANREEAAFGRTAPEEAFA